MCIRDRLSFVQKPLHPLFGREFGPKHFDGHVAVEAEILCPPNAPHSPAADLFDEFVAGHRQRDATLQSAGLVVASIRDLAENMIRLAGLSVKSEDNPTGDIAIVETGTRPGEKLTEELFFDPANAERTEQPKILRSPPAARSTSDLEAALANLARALECEDEAEVRRVLFGQCGGRNRQPASAYRSSRHAKCPRRQCHAQQCRLRPTHASAAHGRLPGQQCAGFASGYCG